MLSLRKLMNKPRPDDWAPLAKFFYADEALNCIDEIIHDSLPGQLWFGAECLAAGSSIIDHESESDAIRPLAKELTRHLDSLRDLLKDQSLRDPLIYTDAIKESLLKFDHLFAAFEFQGLIYYPEGALNVDGPQENISEMFRPYYSLLSKIRNLLLALTPNELLKVEKILCTGETQVTEEKDALTMAAFRSNHDSNDSRTRKPFANLQLKHYQQCDSDYGSGAKTEKTIEKADGDCISEKLEIDEDYESGTQDEVDVEPSCASEEDESRKAEYSLDDTCMSPNAFELRSKFQSADDLIHRLFVCISGVADQLQTNYSSEVRKVLKLILQPTEVIPVYEVDILTLLRFAAAITSSGPVMA
ncbi:hypothetical protein ANCDUO_06324 [Ancylostoma duodenale]|uniref:Uncharacterized protein n=1 Tax=Ancylostoma duodenale TaxID=51022 RepID=A0A0C2GWG3_9BILA|nr:hypothetical protein ANCDUO_06324 [Ancylostoma duodenale]